MSSDIHLAFSHPQARAEASAPRGPLDRISLRDHVVEVEIGAFQPERGATQRVLFNLVVEVAPGGPVDDDVDRILSYDTLTEAIAIELAAERLNLLETLAERIAARILAEPRAVRCFVRIEKLDRGPGALGVEIVRRRGQAAPLPLADAPDAAPHPVVLHLSNAAAASAGLAGWLDRLEAGGTPAILCLGLPDAPRPRAGHPAAQRRIDLLAIEQNAWALAARDRRCIVVDSRTELDWAMKHGQISVWAPSKIVLDTPDHSAPDPASGPALSAWFAGQMEARELIVIDTEPPRCDIATRRLALTDPLP